MTIWILYDRLLADNWMNTNANGTVTTKEQLLTLLRTNPFKIQSIESDDVMLRIYGDSAVVTGRSTSTRVGPDNQVVTGQVRFTRVYSKSVTAGEWSSRNPCLERHTDFFNSTLSSIPVLTYLSTFSEIGI